MKSLNLFRKILCLVDKHSYEHKFLPYGDQPYLTGKSEDELCTIEGCHIHKCKYCGKEKDISF